MYKQKFYKHTKPECSAAGEMVQQVGFLCSEGLDSVPALTWLAFTFVTPGQGCKALSLLQDHQAHKWWQYANAGTTLLYTKSKIHDFKNGITTVLFIKQNLNLKVISEAKGTSICINFYLYPNYFDCYFFFHLSEKGKDLIKKSLISWIFYMIFDL